MLKLVRKAIYFFPLNFFCFLNIVYNVHELFTMGKYYTL